MGRPQAETVRPFGRHAAAAAGATIPNALSTFRIAAAPVLVALAAVGNASAFLALFIVSVVTDGVDGTIARWLKQESSLGARLDAIGDAATWIATPVALYVLVPGLILPELPLFIAGGSAMALSATVSFIKYRRVAVYHSWAAKTVAWLLSVGTISLLVTGWPLPFQLGSCLMLLTAAEEILITRALPTCRSDVPTIWHARRLSDNPQPRV